MAGVVDGANGEIVDPRSDGIRLNGVQCIGAVDEISGSDGIIQIPGQAMPLDTREVITRVDNLDADGIVRTFAVI